jgi:hypothetical protein
MDHNVKRLEREAMRTNNEKNKEEGTREDHRQKEEGQRKDHGLGWGRVRTTDSGGQS